MLYINFGEFRRPKNSSRLQKFSCKGILFERPTDYAQKWNF